jgi:hypothetical protein
MGKSAVIVLGGFLRHDAGRKLREPPAAEMLDA